MERTRRPRPGPVQLQQRGLRLKRDALATLLGHMCGPWPQAHRPAKLGRQSGLIINVLSGMMRLHHKAGDKGRTSDGSNCFFLATFILWWGSDNEPWSRPPPMETVLSSQRLYKTPLVRSPERITERRIMNQDVWWPAQAPWHAVARGTSEKNAQKDKPNR